MTTHSKLSPSARHRWGACPGSVREEARYPESPSGPAAIDGTHSHTLLDKCVSPFELTGELVNPAVFVGTELSDHEGTFTVDADRAKRVKIATDYISERIATREQDGHFPAVLAEQRVYPDDLVHRDDMSGTVDVQLIDSQMIEIIDYKDGMHPVEAKENPQMQVYAVGAYCGLIKANRSVSPQLTIRMTIIQPKLATKGMNPISSWECTLGELMIAKEKMIAEGAAADAPDAPLIPGEAQCKYCAHKGACSALSSKVLGDAGIVFPIIDQSSPVATLDITYQAADKDPTKMSDEQLVEILEAAPLLRQMLEAAEKEAQTRLEAGKQITGLKLVNGRGTRAWNKSEDEMVGIFKKMGVPTDDCYTRKLVSPAQAEKLSWRKRDGTLCSLSDKHVVQLKREFTATTTGKPVMALASDPRPAVTISAAAMFEAVTQSDSIPAWLS